MARQVKGPNLIQQLLAEAGAGARSRELVAVDSRGAEAAADWGNLKSPEAYLGYERAESFASSPCTLMEKRSWWMPSW